MAAAEYYNPSGGSLQVPPHGARPQQRPMNQGQQQNMGSLPYPVSDAPPPYSIFGDQQRPSSQPPPQNRVHFQPNGYTPNGHTPNAPPFPNQSYNGGYQYPPGKQGQGPPPRGWAPQGAPVQQPQGQAGYPFPNGISPIRKQSYQRPADDDDDDSDTRSPSRSRSRSRDRRRRHHHHHHDGVRPPMDKKKSSGVGTFLGAGGGAIIGDAIFPGLGTLGGLILGGVGGHEYEKQRRSYSNPSRGRERRYSDETYDDRRGRRY